MNKLNVIIFVMILLLVSGCRIVTEYDSPNQSIIFDINVVTQPPSLPIPTEVPITPTIQDPPFPTKSPTTTNTPSPSPSITVSPTATSTITTSPTIMSSPTTNPKAIVIVGLTYIFRGPGYGSGFKAITEVTNGTELAILGRNEEATWLKVSQVNSIQGWIDVEVVKVNVPIDSIEIMSSPPTPTIPSPTPTKNIITIHPKGDINGDCIVTEEDRQYILDAYSTNEGDAGYNPKADLNNDGTINVSDLVKLTIQLGKKCTYKEK